MAGPGRHDRGYITWVPHGDAALRVQIALSVLEEYEDYAPLTVRQIYYRAVGAHGRPKTKQEYDSFLYAVKRARRARLISMDAIRDDGGANSVPYTFGGVGDFRDEVASDVERYKRDRQHGQPVYIEVHCEAAGMVDQLAEVALPYGVPVYSAGGQPSVSAKWQTAKRAILRTVPTLILHLGDADHHGHLITANLIDDTAAFVAAHNPGVPLAGRRVALTDEQIAEHDLPAAPDGKHDYQLEALAPPVIAGILRDAVTGEIDHEAFEQVKSQEESDRGELREWLGDAS